MNKDDLLAMVRYGAEAVFASEVRPRWMADYLPPLLHCKACWTWAQLGLGRPTFGLALDIEQPNGRACCTRQ